MSQIRKRAIGGLKKGDVFTLSRTFDEQDVVNFADISRDYNPVHFDERFAKAKKFDTCICHGLLVASLITEIGGQIGWLASGMNLKFRKPVYCGDTVTCDFTITDLDEKGKARAESVFINSKGLTVAEATLTGFIPGVHERQVMQWMMEEGDTTNKHTRNT